MKHRRKSPLAPHPTPGPGPQTRGSLLRPGFLAPPRVTTRTDQHAPCGQTHPPRIPAPALGVLRWCRSPPPPNSATWRGQDDKATVTGKTACRGDVAAAAAPIRCALRRRLGEGGRLLLVPPPLPPLPVFSFDVGHVGRVLSCDPPPPRAPAACDASWALPAVSIARACVVAAAAGGHGARPAAPRGGAAQQKRPPSRCRVAPHPFDSHPSTPPTVVAHGFPDVVHPVDHPAHPQLLPLPSSPFFLPLPLQRRPPPLTTSLKSPPTSTLSPIAALPPHCAWSSATPLLTALLVDGRREPRRFPRWAPPCCHDAP